MAATAIDLQPYASLNDEDCDRRILRAKQALEEMVIWDYDLPMGGLTAEQIDKARIILWKGFCSVPEDVANNARIALQRMLDI
jgi:quinolinate synthase